ncbi:hypothetical protein PsorP6_000581 [Peronosclerospora sorghi]|uniref:Uncharacterized protein n=1 Tax=Peronosclerospora sorghi TaxID=230839 RepID=A0ACC0WRN7_9STRA|nr:hypothetical protein PsorP6_000581 [Peronosclerospora sorghi]
MEFLRAPVDALAQREDFPVNGFRLIVALAGCNLVAPLLHFARNETSRNAHRGLNLEMTYFVLRECMIILGHVFNILAGLAVAVFVFDLAVLHTIGTAVAVYLLLMFAPRNHVGRIVLPLLLAYLVGVHYYREAYNPDLVWDAAQMILTLKLSSIAISYSDGGLPKEKKTPLMIQHELHELPALIPYFGYIFFFPTYLAGPMLEFKNYLYWMKISAAGFVASIHYPVEEIDSPDFYPKSSWMRRILMCVRVVLFRVRYYLVWSLAEAASAIAGIGYVPKTGKWYVRSKLSVFVVGQNKRFFSSLFFTKLACCRNGITNNNLLCVEVPTNFRVAINNWNMGVARWINTYIYHRIGVSKSGKPGFSSTMASFFVSALWHGLAPGYYLFFLSGGIYIEVGKHVRRRLRSYFHYTDDRDAPPHAIFLSYFNGTAHPLAVVYDVAGVFFTWLAMQYAGIAFEILDVRRCLAIWRSWYFLPHLVSLGILMICTLVPPPRRSSPKKQQ